MVSLNCPLLVYAGVLTALGSYLCLLTSQIANDALTDMINVAKPKELEPCGVSVPDLADITYGTGMKQALPQSRSGSDAFYNQTKTVLCKNVIVDALPKLFTGEESGNFGFDDTEYSMESGICLFGESARMDVLSRIRRAYVRAQPAFAHYATFISERCAGGPFSDADCPQGSSVEQQMHLAATESSVYSGSIGISTRTMLYRLVALATVSYWDYADNEGGCFENKETKQAETLCADAFSGDAFSGLAVPPAPPTSPLTGGNTAYDILYNPEGEVKTCGEVPVRSPPPPPLLPSYLLSPPPPPTPPPPNPPPPVAAPLAMNYGANLTGDPWIVNCLETHKIGLYETEQLFGMPDPQGSDPSSSQFDLYNTLMHTYYWNNREGGAENPKGNLRVFMGARMVLTLIWLVPAICAATFFLASGLMPLLRLIPIASTCINQVCRCTPASDPIQPIVKPRELLVIEIIAMLTSVFLFFWVFFCDPFGTPLHQRASCSDYKTTGNVFDDSSRIRLQSGILVGGLVLASILCLLYHLWLRRSKQSLPAIYRKPFTKITASLLVAMLAVLLQITFEGAALGFRLATWNTAVKSNEGPNAIEKAAEDFVKSTAILLGGVSLTSLAVGVLAMSWAIEGTKIRRFTFFVYTVVYGTLCAGPFIAGSSLGGDTLPESDGHEYALAGKWTATSILAVLGGGHIYYLYTKRSNEIARAEAKLRDAQAEADLTERLKANAKGKLTGAVERQTLLPSIFTGSARGAWGASGARSEQE